MPTEEKLTGYPSIDRPQEKFYRETQFVKLKPTNNILKLSKGVGSRGFFKSELV